jgi:3-methyladenine DNA glycosylase AlkD
MDAGDLAALRGELRAAAQPADAPAMAAYMKHRFQFLGVKTPARRAASKPFIDAHKAAPGDELIATARLLWRQPEREFHYVATDLLSRWQRNLCAEHLVGVHELITTNSWWDTVDALAAHVVGGLVQRNHGLTTAMDAWIDDPDIWLARSAILHQLAYRSDTDADRLFGYCLRRAADTEFFIRKAIGWALRQYSYVDPNAVQGFVDAHRQVLSGLTVREALKHISRSALAAP